MGLQIGNIVSRKEVELKDLKGKIIAVDAFNAIYQFLSSIRQPDGTPLMDSKQRVTSHLSGLFYRNLNLLNEGIKLIYVFDGEYHKLKRRTQDSRGEVRDEMKEKYGEAVDDEDIEGMRRYSVGFVKLDEEKIKESKELLEAMGIAVAEAPGEGEMQCAQLVRDGEAYAVGSQDYDSIVVGGKKLIQNLTLSKTRKTRGGVIYIAPEMIEYERVLNELSIDSDRLICLAILVGTDFNPGGIKGIGPKKALALVKSKRFPVEIFSEFEGRMDFNWQEVFEIFKKPNVIRGMKINFPKFDSAKIIKLLVDEHEFSLDRINNSLDKLGKVKK